MTSHVPFYRDKFHKLFIEIYGTFGTNYLGFVTENSSFVPFTHVYDVEFRNFFRRAMLIHIFRTFEINKFWF